MLTIVILYFLTRMVYSATQTATIGEHTPAFYDIEYARLKRIMSEYSAQIPKTRAKYQYNISMLELCKKYNSSQKTMDALTAQIDQSVAAFNRQQHEMDLNRANIHEIDKVRQTNRASTAADFAYEMAYKNSVARIPTMISFMAKRMTRTK